MEQCSQCLYNGNSCRIQNMMTCALYKIWQLVPKCHIMASVHRRLSQSSYLPSELQVWVGGLTDPPVYTRHDVAFWNEFPYFVKGTS